MKQANVRISKIIEELLNDFLRFGCTSIDIHMREDVEAHCVRITGNYDQIEVNEFRKMKRLMQQPRNPQMEEYYWNLQGNSSTDTEYALLGIMSDEVKITIDEEKKILTVELTRNK